MAQTNPNNANQYALDPRQKLCWEAYANPKSGTFGNALQSALKAGYEQTYAETITSTLWFSEKVRRLNMLGKAERVLDEVLSLPVVTAKGETDKGVIDVAKFVAETQGKAEGYSKRQEVTGADGAPAVVFQISEAIAAKNGLIPPNDPLPSPEPHSS